MDIRAEELMLTIETTLYKVTESKLRETADYLKVPDSDGLSKRALIRKINELLDVLCDKEKDKTEDLRTSLEDILAFLCGTPPPLEKTPDEDTQLLERAKEEYNELQKDFLKMMAEQEQKINEVKSRMQRLSGQADEKEPLTPTPLPNIPFGRSENGRPIVIENREVPFRMFLDLEILKFMALFLMEKIAFHIQILVSRLTARLVKAMRKRKS